ncbi:MAG TPA: hypothetical protein VMS96_08490 [Terriglobales bacterium]|nr:hypothetical protein [Terriglobales bacterium]
MKTGYLAIAFAVLLAIALWCWHPVCVPMEPEVGRLFESMTPEQRNESQWGIRTFQRRDGQWCQCKPWLAREMFF